MLAERAAEQFSEGMIPILTRIAERHSSALDAEDYATSVQMVFEFKFTIYRAAQLPITLKMVEGLWLRTAPHIHLMYPRSRETRSGVRYHRDALSALRAADPAAVRMAMQRDLIESRMVLLEALERISAASG